MHILGLELWPSGCTSVSVSACRRPGGFSEAIYPLDITLLKGLHRYAKQSKRDQRLAPIPAGQ
jgi:hypothetical protein